MLRGPRDFEDLAACRRFLDELVGRRGARRDKRIELERAALRPLPPRRAEDGEDGEGILGAVTSSGGFPLRKVFHSAPSRLIGHRLRVRIHDGRLEVFLGATHLMTRPRGRSRGDGRHGHVVDYRHVIHTLRRKPLRRRRTSGSTALPGLVDRDQLFPRVAYRRLFEAATAAPPQAQASRLVVEALFLAHERACEAELAAVIAEALDAGALPDMAALRRRFTPDPAALPKIEIPRRSLGLLRRPHGRGRDRGRRGMSATDPAREARLGLPLSDLCLPAIKAVWPAYASAPTRKGGPPPACSPPSPSTRSPQPRPAAHRAPPRRGAPAARKDPRQLQLRRRAHGLQGPGHGAGRR